MHTHLHTATHTYAHSPTNTHLRARARAHTHTHTLWGNIHGFQVICARMVKTADSYSRSCRFETRLWARKLPALVSNRFWWTQCLYIVLPDETKNRTPVCYISAHVREPPTVKKWKETVFLCRHFVNVWRPAACWTSGKTRR